MTDPAKWLYENTDLVEFGAQRDGVSLTQLTNIFSRPRYMTAGGKKVPIVPCFGAASIHENGWIEPWMNRVDLGRTEASFGLITASLPSSTGEMLHAWAVLPSKWSVEVENKLMTVEDYARIYTVSAYPTQVTPMTCCCGACNPIGKTHDTALASVLCLIEDEDTDERLRFILSQKAPDVCKDCAIRCVRMVDKQKTDVPPRYKKNSNKPKKFSSLSQALKELIKSRGYWNSGL